MVLAKSAGKPTELKGQIEERWSRRKAANASSAE
jgi:hypothetical protein